MWEALKGWFIRFFWPRAAVSDIQADTEAIRVAVGMILRKVDQINEGVITLSEREDAAWAKLSSDIQAVSDGWASLIAERDQWKAAAEAANADAAAQVQAALDADSEHDADAVEAANAALESLLAAPQPPADNGGGAEVPPTE